MRSQQSRLNITLAALAALALMWSWGASGARPDARLVQAAHTPAPVPVFGLGPRVYLPAVLNATALAPTFSAPQLIVPLPPGAPLPSDADCAARVKSTPETKGVNTIYNSRMGDQRLGSDIFGGSDPRAYTDIAARVTGRFSGTTDMILQWAACKWGIDPDMVRAQAAVESGWRQNARGDWGSDPDHCPPSHGLGMDDPEFRPEACPESWGLFQIRYPYQVSAWPGMAESSAFNADTALAIWRACYEGYEVWLNAVDKGQDYQPGDTWGCVGRWYAGRWHTPAAEAYIGYVKSFLANRVWEQPAFEEP